jgi:hypothetical protein
MVARKAARWVYSAMAGFFLFSTRGDRLNEQRYFKRAQHVVHL